MDLTAQVNDKLELVFALGTLICLLWRLKLHEVAIVLNLAFLMFESALIGV